MPTLALENFGFGPRHRLGIAPAPLDDTGERPDQIGGSLAARHLDAHRLNPVAHVGIGVADQPIEGLHDVAIGVVIDSPLRVWHRDQTLQCETCSIRRSAGMTPCPDSLYYATCLIQNERSA